MEYITQGKEKRNFRDIVLQQINKILELSCEEFRGGYSQKKIIGSVVVDEYIPDSRKRIIQAIEYLKYILEPHFKESTKTQVNKTELKLEENLKSYQVQKKIDYEQFITTKLILMNQIFRELNFLLKELDYLTGESYEDVMGELDDEDEEDD